MKCTECGHENANNPKYCTRCGQMLGGGAAPSGNQVRKTVGVEGMFDAPAAPMAPPPPRPAVTAPAAGGGQPRRTVLDDGGAPGVPAPKGFPPPPPPAPAAVRQSAPVPAAVRSKTILDEEPLPAAAPIGGAAPAPVAAPGTARIVGWMVSYDRNAAGQDYVIRAGRNRIGRSRDNEVSLFFEPKASEHHATLMWRNGQTGIKDEGSTNGTFVNGEDIGFTGQGFQPLRCGDTVTFGGSTFVVFLIDPAQARGVWPQSPWGV